MILTTVAYCRHRCCTTKTMATRCDAGPCHRLVPCSRQPWPHCKRSQATVVTSNHCRCRCTFDAGNHRCVSMLQMRFLCVLHRAWYRCHSSPQHQVAVHPSRPDLDLLPTMSSTGAAAAWTDATQVSAVSVVHLTDNLPWLIECVQVNKWRLYYSFWDTKNYQKVFGEHGALPFCA